MSHEPEPVNIDPHEYDLTRGATNTLEALIPTVEEADQHTPGAKNDAGKPDLSLLQFFARALTEVAWVGTYGQEKYTRGGWESVPNGIDRYTGAMLRHFMAEKYEGIFDVSDPWYDSEAGQKFKETVRHDAQVAWNALARLELRLREEQQHDA